jgi:hypothetical protein
MCRFRLSSLTCVELSYFSTSSHKRNEFRGKKYTEYEICVLIFATNSSEICLILRRIQRDTIIRVHMPSCKVPVILVRFLWNLKFLDRFSKHIHVQNFMKIRPVGDVPRRRTERQTDRQTATFRNFANALKSRRRDTYLKYQKGPQQH